MSRACDFEKILLGEQIETPEVISRVDMLWNAIVSGLASVPIVPKTKIERYLANVIDDSVTIPEAETRLDRILYAICTEGTVDLEPRSENEELLIEILEEGVLVRNLFPYPYTDGQSKTHNGITYTVNSDKSVTADGTATADSEFKLQAWAGIALDAGSYVVSGCPIGGTTAGYCINYAFRLGADYPLDALEYGSGLTVTLASATYQIYGNILIGEGTTVNNLVFHPKLKKEA